MVELSRTSTQLDFDSVSAAGSYTISVSGAIAATSPSFQINSGANLYSTPACQLALFLRENERDGANFIAIIHRCVPPLDISTMRTAKAYFTPTFNRKRQCRHINSYRHRPRRFGWLVGRR